MSQDFSKIAENIANSTNASYSYSPETELLLYLASVLIFVIAIVFAAVKLKRPHRLNFINLVLLAEYLWVVAYSNNSEFQLLNGISLLILLVVTSINIKRAVYSLRANKGKP